MSEMVDRVAAALMADSRAQNNQFDIPWAEYIELLPCLAEPWRRQARVVIAAMREPTGAMVDAALYDEYDWAANNWRAMIDVALSPPTAQSLSSHPPQPGSYPPTDQAEPD